MPKSEEERAREDGIAAAKDIFGDFGKHLTPPSSERTQEQGAPTPEVVNWRGMRASTGFKRVLADVLPLGDALADQLEKETDRRRRAEILLTATQQAYVRDHEALSSSERSTAEQAWQGFKDKCECAFGPKVKENFIQALKAYAPSANRRPNHLEICQAVARGWCSPNNEHKEMDEALAFAIAVQVEALLARSEGRGA